MTRVLDRAQFALLAVAVAATIATHLGHLPAWLAPVLALAIGLRVAWRRRHPGAVRAALRLPLAAALLVAVIGEYGNVFGRDPGSAFGCGLLALKLLEAETARDARVALAFCAFVLMSALLFDQSLAFSLLVATVLWLQVAALNRLEPAPLAGRQPLWRSLALAARLGVAALPLALVAFVLVPRLATPLWGAPGSDGVGRTGLTDRMAPGQFSELMLDDSPAMRVAFDGALPPVSAQYFRAIVLSDFDGTTWTRSLSGLRQGPRPIAAGSGQHHAYRVTLEANRQRWLPALEVPVSVPDGALLAGDDTLIANQPVTQPREYHVASIAGGRDTESLPDYMRRRLLRLPAGFGSRARALAQQWHSRAGGDDEAVVREALVLFRSSFSYTLEPPLLGRDSVDEFLFDTRAGFCEHYASAFVFLMRAAGIPARVVTGYQGGWWSGAGGYLLVRQSDAHAWSEIWMQGRGWVRIDPTAAVAPERIRSGEGLGGSNTRSSFTVLGTLLDSVDWLRHGWNTVILGFNAARQRSLLLSLGVDASDWREVGLALLAAFGLALAATLWLVLRGGNRPADPLVAAWLRFCARLARRGVVRAPHEAPLAYGERAARALPPLAEDLRRLSRDYSDQRYAAEVDEQARRALIHALRSFRPRRLRTQRNR